MGVFCKGRPEHQGPPLLQARGGQGRSVQRGLGKASKISLGLRDARCLWNSADGPAQLAGLLPWHLQHL